MATTDEEARALASAANGYVWPQWFGPFGFNEALRQDGESGPLSIAGNFEDLYERDFELVGSPDTVSRKIERLQKELDVRFILLWTYNGLVPHAKLMRSIELFATQVMPRFAD